MADETTIEETEEVTETSEVQENKEETKEVENKEETSEVQEEKKEEGTTENQEEGEAININLQTEFELRLQEFDKNIAKAEFDVADLKKQKMEFIYDRNVQLIISQHKANKLEAETQAEVKRKLAKADSN